MIATPRAVVAPGIAAAAGASLLVTGRVDGSIVLAGILALACRASACAASPGIAAARSMTLQARVVPAWAGVIVAAGHRAGSFGAADVRGAHAVAGPGLTTGEPLLVAGMWAIALAAVLAIAAPAGEGPWALASDRGFRRLEVLGVGVQVVFAAGLLAGPQTAGVADLVPWVAVVAGIGGVAYGLARARVRPDALVAASWAAAGAGVALVLAGGPL